MILVTGGLGFIGSHTGRALLERARLETARLETARLETARLETAALDVGGDEAGAPLLAGRNTAKASEIVAGAAVVEMDCTDPASVAIIGDKFEITAIVHLASSPLGTGAYEQVKGNLLALMTMIDAARRWGVRRMVVASTIGVYGGVDAPVLREDLPLPLASPHAIPAAKKAGEIVAGAVDDIEIVCARIGAVWGPLGRERSPFFAAPQLVHAAAGKDAAVTAQADDGIDMLYVRDCGRAIAGLVHADRLRHKAYNVGSGRSTTNGEVAAVLGTTLPAGGVAAAPLDVTRLREDTGFVPEWDLQRAVTDYRDWLSRHER